MLEKRETKQPLNMQIGVLHLGVTSCFTHVRIVRRLLLTVIFFFEYSKMFSKNHYTHGRSEIKLYRKLVLERNLIDGLITYNHIYCIL